MNDYAGHFGELSKPTLIADHGSAVVELPNGSTVTHSEARAKGYRVNELKAPVRTPSAPTHAERAQAQIDADVEKRYEYAIAIRNLPEAVERPASARTIIAAHNFKSMPPERAATFLRGLPVEERPQHVAPKSRVAQATAESALRRKVELRAAALSVRADRGDTQARQEHTKISYALKIVSASNSAMSAALSGAGLDPSNY